MIGGRILNGDGTVQASARAFPGHRNALFNRHSLTTRFLPRNRYSAGYLMSEWAHDEVRSVDWVSGAFMFIHRRAIERVGLLDPAYFFSIEDVDYSRRGRDGSGYFQGVSIGTGLAEFAEGGLPREVRAPRGLWRYYRKHAREPGAERRRCWHRRAFRAARGLVCCRTAKNRDRRENRRIECLGFAAARARCG